MGVLLGLAEQIEDRTPAQQAMVEDGLPPGAIMAPEERREAWKGRKTPKPRENIADQIDALGIAYGGIEDPYLPESPQKGTKAVKIQKKTSKADQVAALRTKRAAAKGPKAGTKASAGKKAAKAKARTPAAPRATAGPASGPRPGSKVALVAGLLTRKEGCTAADIKEACEWTAVSMPAQAKAAGLTLRQEKIDGVTHYYGTAAA